MPLHSYSPPKASMTVLNRALFSLLLFAAISGAQAARTLPLEAGTYIDGGVEMKCADTANAGTLYFDGTNLQGPHLESCRTTIQQVAHDGKTFTSESACNEEDKAGQPMKQKVLRTIRVDDRTHFQLLMANATPREFHRCGAYPAH